MVISKEEIIFESERSLLTIFRSFVPGDESAFYEHHHTAFEVTMVLGGSGIYCTKSNELAFENGDIFFFGSDEFHWLKKLDCDTAFLNIHFEPRFIWSDNPGLSGRGLIKMFFDPKKRVGNKIDAESDCAKYIRQLIYRMEIEALEKKQEYQTVLKAHLINILVEIMRTGYEQCDESDAVYSTHTLRHMEKVLNYIDEHFDSDITLDELSAAAHMSKNYFCRQFKELNGISPWEYITIRRIERAISYIESTDLTKLEIAVKCGYNNTSNFYHAFKKVTGKSPSDYKRG